MTPRSVTFERWLYFGLVVSTTTTASARFWSILRVDGFSWLKLALFALFAVLVFWIAASFWISALGAYLRWRKPSGAGLPVPEEPENGWSSPSRTAIVVPIHNEDVGALYARLEAICDSLEDARATSLFDLFILSDSTTPDHWILEELAWQRLRERVSLPLYYRHRMDNSGRKSGNIRDFCENWGAAYDYMVVLDADSLMTGQTLARLVALMDANPRAALIQVPPALVGRHSLFARMQQFASSVYGPACWEGLAFLQGPDSNYWGHNAIIRVAPFMQHCGLPALPGRAPLGGEILSHDFVEAALLRRAGWSVWMAPQLGGSFEEPPPTLLQYLKRDRRWCEGNLQHMRLIFARGFRMPNRVHLAFGVMSYLAAPLWLALLIVAGFETFRERRFAPVAYNGIYPVLASPISHQLEFAVLVLIATLLLFGPKFLGLLELWRDPERLRAHGGRLSTLSSVLLESLYSTLLAPIVMLSHASFVLSILTGHSTVWGAQQRSERRVPLLENIRTFLPHTMAAIAGLAAADHFIPACIWWIVPLAAGPLLSIPLALLASSAGAGRLARRWQLFLIPAETGNVPIVRALGERMREHQQIRWPADPVKTVLRDPVARALHLGLLRDSQEAPLARQPGWMSFLADEAALSQHPLREGQ
ncbi:MAG TPA: glucans biosynthesis glucosyltransferase MdoH [Rhizomicrobium sp.]|jgi:membrane glycosyltransferase